MVGKQSTDEPLRINKATTFEEKKINSQGETTFMHLPLLRIYKP